MAVNTRSRDSLGAEVSRGEAGEAPLVVVGATSRSRTSVWRKVPRTRSKVRIVVLDKHWRKFSQMARYSGRVVLSYYNGKLYLDLFPSLLLPMSNF